MKKQAEVVVGIASVSILLEERLKKEAEVKKIIGKIKLRLPRDVASAVIFKKEFVKIYKIDLTKKKKKSIIEL